jgi:hypothetical protein
VLARHFGTLDRLAAASRKRSWRCAALGDIIAVGVESYFRDPAALRLIESAFAGVNFTEPHQVVLEVPSVVRPSS